MKCLSLTQPWASLVALGAKRVETRSWATPHRGELAIHASKAFPAAAKHLLNRPAFSDALVGRHKMAYWRQIPVGKVLATCRLADVVPISDHYLGRPCVVALEDELTYCEPLKLLDGPAWAGRQEDTGAFAILDLNSERPFGDWTYGRYAWLLEDVRPLERPVEARGALGLWNWEGA